MFPNKRALAIILSILLCCLLSNWVTYETEERLYLERHSPGWEEGWKKYPEAGGIAAAIKSFRSLGTYDWPASIDQALSHARILYAAPHRRKGMPQSALLLDQKKIGGTFIMLPNGAPTMVGMKKWQVPNSTIILRWRPNSDSSSTIDFTWGGALIEYDESHEN